MCPTQICSNLADPEYTGIYLSISARMAPSLLLRHLPHVPRKAKGRLWWSGGCVWSLDLGQGYSHVNPLWVGCEIVLNWQLIGLGAARLVKNSLGISGWSDLGILCFSFSSGPLFPAVLCSLWELSSCAPLHPSVTMFLLQSQLIMA